MSERSFRDRPIADFLPHRSPMILLDRILAVGDDHLDSEVVIRPDSPFIEGGSVGAWVGVEYMAQTIAAFAGIEAVTRGEAVRVGFLLGAREYRSRLPGFPVGLRLRVRVSEVHREVGGLSVVECKIFRGDTDEVLVEATLTVYEVCDMQSFLATHRGGS